LPIFLPALNFAQRARCAAAILFRPAAEIVRFFPHAFLLELTDYRLHQCLEHEGDVITRFGHQDSSAGPLVKSQNRNFTSNLSVSVIAFTLTIWTRCVGLTPTGLCYGEISKITPQPALHPEAPPSYVVP
jgi:hypothetical protein